ncbi:MAG TPA: hypothetical protein VE623_21280 [Acidimicrobiales bacterium]|nr:hypothetical protein [Acidimicrobiales bacterium]
MPVRRLAALAIPWVVVLGFARGVIALPERCPPASAPEARAAAQEAVGWFQRNQRDDGHWVYRYDRDADAVDLQDHVVRQAGVTLSLYQAHAAGIAGALAPADRGVEWLLGELVRHDDWAAVERGGLAPTGGTALLVAALSTRRIATDDPRFDRELDELGRFLVVMTEPSGAVLANWDVDARRPVPGDYSKFFTGEAYFALSLLATADPGGGWLPTAERIGRYLPERDGVEDRFPPTSDHWGAYGLAQLAVDVGRPLGADESAWGERLAGLFGVEVRFESQRTGEGLTEVLRGPQIVGAGLGTIGEGLGSLWRLSAVDDRLAGERGVLSERLRCVAGMLVDRQVDATEAADAGRPRSARGAWFYKGLTQMDDQQHSLSALLLAERALAEKGSAGGGSGSSDDDVSAVRALWLALVALASVNPVRVRQLIDTDSVSSRAVAVGTALALAGFVALAAVGDPLFDAIDVSPATGLLAAGLVVAVSALVDAVRRPVPWGPEAAPTGAAGARAARCEAARAGNMPRGGGADVRRLIAVAGRGAVVPVAVPALVRPAVALLLLAVAADAGIGPALGAAAAAALAGAALLLRPDADGGGAGGRLAGTLRWAFAAVAVLGGVDLAVQGVLGV